VIKGIEGSAKGDNVSCVLLWRLIVHSIVVGAFLALFLKIRRERYGMRLLMKTTY
jgi:hypothetical protein